MNIFDGFSTSAIREKAIRNRSRSQDILRQTEARIRLEMATARNDVNVAKERIKVTESAVKQSEENLRINQERYKERVGTATEVLDAQTLNTQAKTDYYNAVFVFRGRCPAEKGSWDVVGIPPPGLWPPSPHGECISAFSGGRRCPAGADEGVFHSSFSKSC
jgi:hypothetical protein